MGTEVNANVNYNIMKGLDFGVYGPMRGWAISSSQQPPARWIPTTCTTSHFRLNYAF